MKDEHKLAQVIIYFLNNTKNCSKTKLFKLLYHLDFEHFKRNGWSVTDLKYYKWKHGPVPKMLFGYIEKYGKKDTLFDAIKIIVDEDGRKSFEPSIKFDKTIFSKNELNLMQNIAKKYKNMTAKQMSEQTHEPDTPWSVTKNGDLILYQSALDGSKGTVTVEEANRIACYDKALKRFATF